MKGATRRRLDAELVRRGLLASRARAVEAIRRGDVQVAGIPAASPARQVSAADPITLAGAGPRYVSRGGDKLAAALARFDVDVRGCRALDAGASTGGFTDCLLQDGAAEVVAVDVGRGQLAWALRTDPRVKVLERTNVRDLDAGAIGGAVPVAVADLSFISLLTVAPALRRCTRDDAELVLLVKPQFEAGRDQVGKGGIVRERATHEAVLGRVVAGLDAAGIFVVDVMASPVRGARGNIELLAHCRRAADRTTVATPPADIVSRAVAEAHDR